MNEKYSLLKLPTPLEKMRFETENNLYIKRDDLTDFALGGNKARKMEFFLADIFEKKCDCLVTYGSMQSNHCRIVAAAACRFNMKCVLVLENSHDTGTLSGNSIFYHLAGAEIQMTPVDRVEETIRQTLQFLKDQGKTPYFIPGGGHAPLGTKAYIAAYEEYLEQSEKLKLMFDYIFHASGTGTTQAGLIIGNARHHRLTQIVGISIARRKERGLQVLSECLEEYANDQYINDCRENPVVLQHEPLFIDDYIGRGYSDILPEVVDVIKDVFRSDSIILDPTYTGKAFYGMAQYLKSKGIRGKNVLFWHTGGLPGLFENASRFQSEKFDGKTLQN